MSYPGHFRDAVGIFYRPSRQGYMQKEDFAVSVDHKVKIFRLDVAQDRMNEAAYEM